MINNVNSCRASDRFTACVAYGASGKPITTTLIIFVEFTLYNCATEVLVNETKHP